MKTALAVVGATLAAVLLCVGGWYGYWHLAKAGQNNRYDVNTHSQQYQAALVSQERDRVAGYDAATDPAQKQQIKATFCAVYLDLTQVPADLSAAHARIC